MTAAELIDELAAAVEEELAEVRASEAARRIPVFNGRCLGQAGADWLYAFGLQYPVTLPDDVPLRIELPGDESYTGQLVAATAFEVTLACGVRLPDKLTSASLTLDTSFILEQLLARLSELEPDACDLPLTLFGLRQPAGEGEAPPLDDPEANEFQLAALKAVLERDVTYVWGPPGTGKTTALALIAEALVRRGLRVLAVASTNVAVDNAVLKVAERLDGVVRFGTPQLLALRQPMPAAAARGSLLQTMPLPFEELSPATVDPEPERPAVAVVPAKRLPDTRDEAARQRTLRQARLVGATLSRLALTPDMASPGFDAVLLDEASAAQLPAVFAAAALARRKVVALGDPRQLPPVAVSGGPLSQRWLQRDVFAQAGLEDDDDRAVLLREQYRMPPAISRLANELVYGGRLLDAPACRQRPGRALLVDTSPEGCHCERQDGSRLNRVHAELAVRLAADLAARGLHERAENGPGTPVEWQASERARERSGRQAADAAGWQTGESSGWQSREHAGSRSGGRTGAQAGRLAGERQVAIITPYRAQARLIWRLLRDARLDGKVDVGTVHRFQGLERRAIVFDTVEGPPQRPAPFVSGGYGSEAMRLLNVAVTRAQSELMVIANVAHLRATLPRNATLRGLLELLAEEW